MSSTRGRRLSTVQTALRVMGFLTAEPGGLEASVVAKRLGKSLSSAYAVLNSLVEEGFAERAGSSYRLVQGVAAPTQEARQLPALEPSGLLDALEELYLRTHERCYLALVHGDELRVQSRGRQGQPRPQGLEEKIARDWHAISLGKAVLAGRGSPNELELRGLTAHTITDPDVLADDLERVRRTGVAVDLEEFQLGFSGVAAPIVQNGVTVAAVGVVMPARRFPFAFARMARAVREVAYAASFGLAGGSAPAEAASAVAPALEPPAATVPPQAAPTLEVFALESLREGPGLRDHALEQARSLEDPAGFWNDWAERFFWFRPYSRVLEGSLPDARWFVGGRTNVCFNAVDRHATGSKRNQLALIALSGDGREVKLSYRELLDRVSRLASALRGLGVGLGDRVVVCLPTGLEAALAMLACARIGAIHVVLLAGLGAAVVRERLEETGARLLIAADRVYQGGRAVPLSSIIEEAVTGLPVRVLWHCRGELRAELEFWRLLEAARPDTPCEALESEHPLFVLYASGATGKPKGVVHAHGGYMVGTTYHLRTFFDARDDDVLWSATDLAWVMGHTQGLYAPLCEGLTVVLLEEQADQPHAGAFFEVIERHGVNLVFTSVPRLRALRLADAALEGRDLSSLRTVATAGETVTPELWTWTLERLNAFVLDHWWQTETGSVVLGTPLAWPARPGKAGVPLPGVDAAIVDAHGLETPVGQRGQLVLRGAFPHLMRGLWHNPQGYRQAFTRLPDGSFAYSSGDLAVRDEQGYIQLLGRADDMIRSGDYRIGALEIESVLAAHPSVLECAVVEALDAARGSIIRVFVVLRDPESRSLSDVLEGRLKAYLRKHFGPTLVGLEVEILERLPRTRSGKLVRRVLRALESGDDPGDVSSLET